MTNAKKEENLYIKTGNNVKRVLEYYGITQTELCSRLVSRRRTKQGDTINVNEKTMSQIVNGKAKLQPEMAKKILAAFPNCPFRLSWLLGYDDYETEGAAFEARWEELAQPARDRKAIHTAVASMMSMCGLQWDGDSTAYAIQHYVSGYREMDPGRNQTVNYNGVEFETWELAAISDKVFDFLQMELKYSVRAKKKRDMGILERQELSIAYRND